MNFQCGMITSFLRHSLLSQWSGRNSLISSEGQRTKLELALPQEANGFARVPFFLVSLLTQHCLCLLRMPRNSLPFMNLAAFPLLLWKLQTKLLFILLWQAVLILFIILTNCIAFQLCAACLCLFLYYIYAENMKTTVKKSPIIASYSKKGLLKGYFLLGWKNFLEYIINSL